MRLMRLFFLFFIFILTSVFLVNCSKNKSTSETPTENTAQNDQNSNLKMQNLEDTNYSFLGKNYKMKLAKIISTDGAQPVYIQWLSNCDYKCPTVVVSNPYAGIDWTDDAGDKVWINKPNSYNGIFMNDTEGPEVGIDRSLGNLFFQSQNKEQTASMGAFFLANELSVLIVNNRFFRGRNLKIYIEEHKKAVRYFVENNFIDQNKMVFWGASLGGFVSTHAALDTKYPPKALALLSPLLDLRKEYKHTEDVQINATLENVRMSYKDFAAPYLRRIIDFTKGSPTEKPEEYKKYEIAYIAENLKSNVFLIHDTWDTLVPVESSTELYGLVKNKNSVKVELVLHQHSTAINWNEFKLDHTQIELKGEGYSNENSQLFYPAYIANQLLDNSNQKTIFYNYTKAAQMLVEFKAAQNRGQDIKWLKYRFKDLCLTNINMVDYSNTISPVTGRYFVQQVMKNIWNFDKSESVICSELDNYFN